MPPVIDFPTLDAAPAMITFSLTPNTQIFESPLNRTIQTMELPGARWNVECEFHGLTASDARMLKAWLARLRGMAGRFRYGDYSHRTPSGSAAGTPLVNGANQSGNTIVTDGWAASQPQLLHCGDYIGIGDELKIITQDSASDASGNATLVFEPPLRHSPPDNSAVIINFPKCIFRLADDDQDYISIDPERSPTVALKFAEVI